MSTFSLAHAGVSQPTNTQPVDAVTENTLVMDTPAKDFRAEIITEHSIGGGGDQILTVRIVRIWRYVGRVGPVVGPVRNNLSRKKGS